MQLKPLFALFAITAAACASSPQPSPSPRSSQDEVQEVPPKDYTCVDEETANLPLVSDYLKVFPVIIGEQLGARYGAPQELSKELALELAKLRAQDALGIIIERLKRDNVTPYLLEPEPDQAQAKPVLLLIARDEQERVKPSQTFAHPLALEPLKPDPQGP